MKKLLASTSDLAEMLGITDRMVRKHQSDGLFQKEARGKYNLFECIPAYVRYRDELHQGDSESLTDQRTRKTKAEADKIELELEILRGRHLPLDLCKTFWQSIEGTVRSKLMSISSSLKTKFPHLEKEVILAIDDHIRDTLSEVSKTGIPPKLSRRLAQYAWDAEAPAEDDRKRVGG